MGKTMAVVEMKAVLIALIANFEFAPAYQGQVRCSKTAVTMSECFMIPPSLLSGCMLTRWERDPTTGPRCASVSSKKRNECSAWSL
ncbi:hypothetical protein C8R43DRAFT_977558 [Mycena crocata]|nr:hypothetical protein C8R43DRAFT_977558 [Mycena crocata]